MGRVGRAASADTTADRGAPPVRTAQEAIPGAGEGCGAEATPGAASGSRDGLAGGGGGKRPAAGGGGNPACAGNPERCRTARGHPREGGESGMLLSHLGPSPRGAGNRGRPAATLVYRQ